jgi:carboxylesterase type B
MELALYLSPSTIDWDYSYVNLILHFIWRSLARWLKLICTQGWLLGPTFLNEHDTVANAGLLDQRLPLQWINKYIYLFGGDPTRVTAMGQGAGGGSIEHQITAYGGSGQLGKAPFIQAILQSPGLMPKYAQNANFGRTLHFASLFTGKNGTSAGELREFSFLELYYTNYAGCQIFGLWRFHIRYRS